MQTYLEHIAENTEHAVESGILGVGTLFGVGLPLDTSHNLGDDDQVDDQGRRQERVFTHVEYADSLMTTEEDLSIVLVQGTFVVTNSGHVLDDNGMVWMLPLLVQDSVGSDHVINHIGLGDLLGAELLLGAQIHAVVVTQVVVAGDGGELDTSTD